MGYWEVEYNRQCLLMFANSIVVYAKYHFGPLKLLQSVIVMKKVTGAWNYTNQFMALVPNYLCGLKAK